ncbi:TPA: hypothetical protein OSY25_004581 [Escherichia coli]|nr:hypothetical protein [Escherichia coli]
MMKSDEKYQVPVWMRPLLPLLCNTGGNDPEELLNDTATTVSANVVRYVLIVAVAKWHLNRSQFGIRIDHDLASISDHSLASQSITIWHASDH